MTKSVYDQLLEQYFKPTKNESSGFTPLYTLRMLFLVSCDLNITMQEALKLAGLADNDLAVFKRYVIKNKYVEKDTLELTLKGQYFVWKGLWFVH